MKVSPIFIVALAANISYGETRDYAQGHLKPAQARDHIGEIRVVCGKVRDSSHLQVRGRPTLLSFGKSRPNHVFVVYVWRDMRKQLGKKAERLVGKEVCVTGEIARELNKPIMHVHIPEQLVEVQFLE